MILKIHAEEKRRVEVLRSQYEALTVDQLLLIEDIAEKDWVKSNYEDKKKGLESRIEFATIAFACF